MLEHKYFGAQILEKLTFCPHFRRNSRLWIKTVGKKIENGILGTRRTIYIFTNARLRKLGEITFTSLRESSASSCLFCLVFLTMITPIRLHLGTLPPGLPTVTVSLADSVEQPRLQACDFHEMTKDRVDLLHRSTEHMPTI
jgi:hypothetical protein